MRIRFLSAVLLCTACSSEAPQTQRGPANNTVVCAAGIEQSCTCTGSATGTQTCTVTGTWGNCECSELPPSDFGNPNDPPQVFDAGPMQPTRPANDCSPGFYLGTYSCEIVLFGLLPVPLAGDVSFNLSINETTVDRECDPTDEFCSDLVISENGGTLFGLASGFIGFETKLEGALDCATGEFRANGVDGRWGTAISTDPNDPNALLTVEDPPMGMFDGLLMGMHTKAAATETIAGNWDLTENTMDINCAGPFTVTLQP